MKTIAIRKILKKIAQSYEKSNKRKLFYRVCACDMLPKKVSYVHDWIIIVNLDESSRKGSHWVGIFLTRLTRTLFFFDSYGMQPNNKYINEFISTHAKNTFWNNRQLQSFYSYCCGEYCCMFAHTMAKGDVLACFMRQFNDKYHRNDEKVQSMFSCTFEKKNCSQCCKSYYSCLQSDDEKDNK